MANNRTSQAAIYEDMLAIIDEMRPEYDYQIVWGSLATNVWLDRRLSGTVDEWEQVRLLSAMNLNLFVKMIKGNGWQVVTRQQTRFSKTLNIGMW